MTFKWSHPVDTFQCLFHVISAVFNQKFMFKFLLSCLKMLILFQGFLRFACHGDYLLGMPPAPPHLPLGEDHMLHPSPGESGSSGGPYPASPSQLHFPGTSGPGDTRVLGLRLCGWGQETCGVFAATSYCKGLLVSTQGSTWAHTMHTHVHWVYTQGHTFLERPL